MNRLVTSILLLGLAAAPALGARENAEKPLRLDGTWRFRLDRDDVGLRDQWFVQKLPDKVKLPGSLPGQGIGDEVTVETKWMGGIVDRSWFTAPEYAKYRQPGNVKVPFWLQPEKYYAGAAWYQRDLEIPIGWEDRRIVLSLERPHWETRVWIDGRCVGTNNALATPHDYDLGTLAPGRHTLTIRVDNRLVVDVGPDSHSVSDHTQGNWNGIVGRIELRATPRVWIEDLQVYPSLAQRNARVVLKIGSQSQQAGTGRLAVVVENAVRGAVSAPVAPPILVAVQWGRGGGRAEFEVSLGEQARGWDEFTPHLYRLSATLRDMAGTEEPPDSRSVVFGLRDLTTRGTQFLLNGRPAFFRGTLECCIFPKTGHPPTEVAEWKRILGVAKAHGLNLIRFHSWCPPEAAFIAADELGFYLHVEASSWANMSSSLGDGKPVDTWIYEETDRMLKYYGNHPSFLLTAYGNEPGGPRHAAFLARWVSQYKAQDARRLWTSGAGWPQIPENQWHSTPDPRIQGWGQGLQSRINGRAPETQTDYRDYIAARSVPVISHEIGQWCVYPNFDEMKKYKGYLKPRNFEIFREVLEAHHLDDQARKFLLASGKLQTLCYKEDIESALRTPGMGGFQLLDLHDFPGQGTALVGTLDPFWEEKGYVTAQEYRRFCNATVPLARLSRRVFRTDERLEATLEVAHFGPAPLVNAVVAWKLMGENGRTWAGGRLPSTTIPLGNGTALGEVDVALKELPAPSRVRLLVSVEHYAPDDLRSAPLVPIRRYFENDWDLWVYPSSVETQPPPGVTIVDDLHDAALAALDAGGKVLLLVPPSRVKNAAKDKVALGFSSIFWNTAWTRRQPPTTLGILCDPRHPALAGFPTDDHSNWQWWYLVTRAGAMILDDLPHKLRPTVQVIDDWVTARRLGLVFEGKVRKGRLLVCSIDLKSGLDQNPVARQMRHSLLEYMAGPKFKPAVELTVEQVRGLMVQPAGLQPRGARAVKASSAEAGFPADQAADGDPNTFWHSAWTGGVAGFPHELTVEFEQPQAIRGFSVLPRQDNNRNGWIREYAFYLSADGQNWGEAVATGSLAASSQAQVVKLGAPRSGRFVRLVARSGYASGPWASLAELDILPAASAAARQNP